MAEGKEIACPGSCDGGKRVRCPDCKYCQNCSERRCRLCRKEGCVAGASALGTGFTFGEYLEWKRRDPG